MTTPADNEPSSEVGQRRSIFRREAIDYHSGARRESRLLEFDPSWTRQAYWAVTLICAFALFFVAVAEVDEYAAGLAIIQSEGRTHVTVRTAGIVDRLEVRPGQHVRAGDVLVRLYSRTEEADAQRIEQEFELQLVKFLRDPDDPAARSALTSLRAERERAQAELEERAVRAPRAGVVSDVRVREGQQLQAGDFILSLADETAQARVLAMLPGQYRPLLRPGMAMRLEIHGYPYVYRTVIIEDASAEIVSPTEVRRYLRQPIADLFNSEGPVVFVTARLPDRTFVVDGRELQFYDGMQATAEVAVRSESVLVALIPGLRALFGDDDEGH